MPDEYKLSYTASEIDARLGRIDNLAAKSDIPTKTSQLTNNSGYITGSDVSAHNASTSAHSDIRALITQLSSEKVGYDSVVQAIGDSTTAIMSQKAVKDAIDGARLFATPQMYGAKGDGVTDDTAAINAAINALPDGSVLYFPDGTYLVSETDSSTNNNRIAIRIDGRNNLTLLLSNEATIKHAPSTSAYYRTIRIDNSNNITIRGGHLVGESDTHTPTYDDAGESIINTHGYGIRMIDSSNITVDGVDISKYYGDPIVICSEDNPYKGCQNVKITNCTIHDSIRNGITVTSCKDLLIKDCDIYNITGANPMAGIDIEGEYTGAENKDIVIDGCNIHDNGRMSVAVVLTAENVQIRNCNLTNPIHNSATSKDLVISDCVIEGASIRSNCTIRNSIIYQIDLGTGCDCLISGCKMYGLNDSPHIVCVVGESSVSARFSNCEFFDPEVQNRLFYTIRTNQKADKLLYNDCIFHLRNQTAVSPFGHNNGRLVYNNCQFISELDYYPKQFIHFQGDDIVLSNCLFDISTMTSYNRENSSLVKVSGTNTMVENCVINANSAVSTYAFHSGNATGDVYYINNILPAWNSIGYMPTTANKLVIQGNVLSGTTGSEYLTMDNIDDVVAAVIEALPAAEEVGF